MPTKTDKERSETPPTTDPRRKAVRIRAGVLHGALKDVAAIAPRGGETIPILSHVLIEVGNGTLAATVSDLDLWARRDCATDDAEQGKDWLEAIRPFALTLPAKPLLDVLGELEAEQAVIIEVEPDAPGRAAITAGRTKFQLNARPAEDFPLPPPFEARHVLEMPCAALADALHAVEHAISTEETRYYLNGVYVHVHCDEDAEWLWFAATDGHRLARLQLAQETMSEMFPSLIVMRATIALLDRLLAAAVKAGNADDPPMVLVEAASDSPGALTRYMMPAADGGEVRITAKTVDGTFPDYTRVIPTDPPNSAVIDRLALAAAVKRVGVIASAKSRMVRAELADDRLTLSVTTPELGTAREEVPCMYDGPAVAMGLNGAFWREALGALASDQVAMSWHGSDIQPLTTQVLLTAVGDGVDRERLVQVLMPMRTGG